jgi:LEA14-like dessication related protein
MKRTLLFATLLTALCVGLAFLTFSLSGCAALQNLNIINPSYSLVDVTPHVNLSVPPSMDFDFTVGIDNPNTVGLALDHFDFNLFVNRNQVANGSTYDRISIPARGNGNVRLRSHVTYENVKTIFKQLVDVIQGNRASYQIQGTAAYDTPVGRMNFPVNVMR